MDAPARRNGRQASPERSMVWREPPPKNKHLRRPPDRDRTVPVVYYLCRNRQLDHPHFIEVPLSSTAGLSLRDVLDRLVALRGKSMPAMYSWSCKRSYKNGYVWQDLAEDDLVIAANGDYILKGTELMDHTLSDSDRLQKDNALKLQSPDHPHPHQASPIFSNTQEANTSSSSPIFVVKEARFLLSPQEDRLSPSSCRQGMVEKWVQKPNPRTNASTQTEDGGRVASGPNTRKKSVWTEDEPYDSKFDDRLPNRSLRFNGGGGNGKGEISPPPISLSATSPCGRMDTLEALIKAEATRINRYRIFDNDDEVFVPMKSKKKATNMLMQVITCGSMSMKGHHSFGITPTSKQNFSHVNIPSSVFTTSVILQEFDLLSENPRVTRSRQEEKKHYSGRTVEANKQKEEEEEGTASLNRSSYYYEHRSIESPDSIRNEQKVVDLTDSKCLPRKTKIASCKQSWKGTISSPNPDARNKSVKLECRPLSSSNGGSRRITDAFSIKGSSMRLESFKQEEMIKIMGN